MPRYAPKMKKDDLKSFIINLAIENNYIEEYGHLDAHNPDMDNILTMLLHEELISKAEKDWSKIDFSTENTSFEGFKETQSGIAYMQIKAGGDWESSLIMILYFDGKSLRGFVPKAGNTYNYDKKSAFGNHDCDYAAAVKYFSYKGKNDDFIEIDPDMGLIEDEIEKRLEVKGVYQASPPKASKASLKAKKQAEIEKDQDLTGDITPDMVWAVIGLAAGGSHVRFKLRSSDRFLNESEGHRVVGVPSILVKHARSGGDDEIVWYSPFDCYPLQIQKILQDAGFENDPDNDLSIYAGAKTVYIRL